MAGGKKKRGHPDVEEVLERPWCYYCERDFDDLKILISHQKAKHFKCERCGRRLNTAGGLSVHMNQVHKETLSGVENALGNRAGLEVEIFGMEGIPEEVVQAHKQRIVTQFYQAEAERRAATGNSGSGGAAGAAKKPKFEAPSDLKKRLAEHKARLAEQAAGGGGSSGGNTPGEGATHGQSPVPGQSPAVFNGSPYAPSQPPFAQAGNYGPVSQEPYAQPVTAYQQPYQQPAAYSQAPQYPSHQAQYASPAQQYPPQQSFPQPAYQQPPSNFPGGPPSQFSAPPPQGYNQYQPPSHTPPQHGLPPRPQTLPQAIGLPQRPSFSAASGPPPHMQQGPPQQHWSGNGWNGPDHQNSAMSSAYSPHSQSYNGGFSANASSVDELVSGAAREADDIDEIIRMAEAGIRPPKKAFPAPISPPVAVPLPPIPSAPASEPPVASEIVEKKAKKDKDKSVKMVYSDNEVSPEEKMARMPRYAFVPDLTEKTVLAEVDQPGIEGVVDEQL